MYPKKLLSAALITSSLFLTGVASAGIQLVDFSPTATNNGSGAIGTAANFSAVGFQSDMSSTFTIGGVAGVAPVTETGFINITSFQNAVPATVISGVNSDYTLGATFTLTGTGLWAGNIINLNPVGASLNVNLYANGAQNNPATGTLIGTASLDASQPSIAFAAVFGSLANGASGAALTSLTASLIFNPVLAYTGPGATGGFFQAPFPLMIDLAIGNAGGNTLNTTYSVAGGVVTILNPPPGNANMGTANVTFQSIPEPGALSLVGLALVGLGVVGRRKTKAAVTA